MNQYIIFWSITLISLSVIYHIQTLFYAKQSNILNLYAKHSNILDLSA